TRSSMLDVLTSEYITAATARGLNKIKVNIYHGLRNAMVPVLTIFGVLAIRIFGGTVIIESIFSIPGLGRLLFESVGNRDYPLLQGLIVVFGISVIIINLVIDLLYSVVDPRLRKSVS